MSDDCTHYINGRTQWTLNDASGDNEDLRIWLGCADCFEEKTIDLHPEKMMAHSAFVEWFKATHPQVFRPIRDAFTRWQEGSQ